MDKWDAISEIQRIAREHNLAVSVITVDDVRLLKGIETEATPEEIAAVTGSWEWRHYGDNWSEWFEGFILDEDA